MSQTNSHTSIGILSSTSIGFLAALIATMALIAGCGGEPSAKVSTAGGTTAAAPVQAPEASAAGPETLVDVFPAAPGRELVLSNCGTCHNVACTAIGQRSAARWDELNDNHKDKVKGVDLDAIFGYLKVNFNESKPEPKVPPKFLEGGCTPF